jgi:hypothetical protein
VAGSVKKSHGIHQWEGGQQANFYGFFDFFYLGPLDMATAASRVFYCGCNFTANGAAGLTVVALK